MQDLPKATTYLTKDTAILVNSLLEYGGSVRDEHLLESALTAPQNAAYYEGADLILQAATLIERLALNHPFIDGNKRTSLIMGATFLLMNDFHIVYQDEMGEAMYGKEIELLVYKRDLPRLVEWLEDHIQPAAERATSKLTIEEAVQITLRQFASDLEYLKDK